MRSSITRGPDNGLTAVRRRSSPIIGVYLLLLLLMFRPMVYPIDPAGYYSWARTILIDGDLNVANEFSHYGVKDVPLTPTGYEHNQWPAGSGILWLPLMLLAHAGTTLAASLGAPIAADGYSWPYVFAASLSSTLAGLAAVLITYALARKLVGNFAALLSSLVVWLATPFVYYQFYEPLFAHANDVLLNALFVIGWWHARQRGDRFAWMVILGLISGLAVWVRVQNAVLLLAVLVEASYDFVVSARHRAWRSGLRQSGLRVAGLVAGFSIFLIPLLIFWHTVYGSWIVNTYQASGGGTFDWRAPHVFDVMISTDRGLFVWAPITLLCLMGVPWLYRTDRRLTALLSGIALLQLYLIGSWSHWEGGAAFGPRFWIGLTPFFTLGLAALFDHLDHAIGAPTSRVALVCMGVLFIAWNSLLMVQYRAAMVAATGPVQLDRMIQNQWLAGQRAAELVVARLEWLRAILGGQAPSS
jgi:hypothetical protein